MARLSLAVGKLQHIYDLHAADFGLSGNKNREQLERLQEAIELHLSNASTTLVHGHDRGENASLHYNSHTCIIVAIAEESSNLLAAFKASPAQAKYIYSTGRLN